MNGQSWYVAEIILRFDIEQYPLVLVNVNLTLLQSTDQQSAYSKAVSMGRASEFTFVNTDNANVIVRFAGLRNLFHVGQNLEEGAEWLSEIINDSTGTGLTKQKADLPIFSWRTPGSKRSLDELTIVEVQEDNIHWYLSELVMCLEKVSEKSTATHIICLLSMAHSSELAFSSAIAMGGTKAKQIEDESNGSIRATFVGLRDLYLVEDEIRDGCELIYEAFDIQESDLSTIIRSVEEIYRLAM